MNDARRQPSRRAGSLCCPEKQPPAGEIGPLKSAVARRRRHARPKPAGKRRRREEFHREIRELNETNRTRVAGRSRVARARGERALARHARVVSCFFFFPPHAEQVPDVGARDWRRPEVKAENLFRFHRSTPSPAALFSLDGCTTRTSRPHVASRRPRQVAGSSPRLRARLDFDRPRGVSIGFINS